MLYGCMEYLPLMYQFMEIYNLYMMLYTLTTPQIFISGASDELKRLFSVHASVTGEFEQMVQYFGEDPKVVDTSDIFSVFSQFVFKFEVRFSVWCIWKCRLFQPTNNLVIFCKIIFCYQCNIISMKLIECICGQLCGSLQTQNIINT